MLLVAEPEFILFIPVSILLGTLLVAESEFILLIPVSILLGVLLVAESEFILLILLSNELFPEFILAVLDISLSNELFPKSILSVLDISLSSELFPKSILSLLDISLSSELFPKSILSVLDISLSNEPFSESILSVLDISLSCELFPKSILSVLDISLSSELSPTLIPEFKSSNTLSLLLSFLFGLAWSFWLFLLFASFDLLFISSCKPDLGLFILSLPLLEPFDFCDISSSKCLEPLEPIAPAPCNAFCIPFATPLAVFNKPCPATYPAVTTLQPDLTPASIPKTLSIIFGPSITATDAPISNTDWVMPLLCSIDQVLNNRYIFSNTDVKNKTTKFETIHLIISLILWPLDISAKEYIIPKNFTKPNSNIILEILNEVANKVIAVQPRDINIPQKLNLNL